MKYDFVPVDLVDDYEANSNTHPPEQLEQIRALMLYVGWTAIPLVRKVGSRYGCIAGHGRRDTAKEAYEEGHTLRMADGTPIPKGSMPVVFADGWTDEQVRTYVIADNKVAANSVFYDDILLSEIEALEEEGGDLSLLGFTDDELAELRGLELEPGSGGEGEGSYTRKIGTPVYETTGEMPETSELYDNSKTKSLISRIEKADIPEDVSEMLKIAAERHTVFSFSKIAEYYAHASPEVQCLMEESAMIIIDFDQAVENGFVSLSGKLAELYGKDYSNDEG